MIAQSNPAWEKTCRVAIKFHLRRSMIVSDFNLTEIVQGKWWCASQWASAVQEQKTARNIPQSHPGDCQFIETTMVPVKVVSHLQTRGDVTGQSQENIRGTLKPERLSILQQLEFQWAKGAQQ
jgi:hypothetical protein